MRALTFFAILALLLPIWSRASGPILAYETSGVVASNGTWQGAPGPAFRLPREALVRDDGVSFAGRGAVPILGNPADADRLGLPATALTAVAVFSIEKEIEWGGVLGYLVDNGSLEKGWVLGYGGKQFYIGLSSQGAADKDGRITYLRGKTKWEPGRLYHVAATYDGTELKLFVNGALDASTKEQHGPILYPPTASLVLGGYRDSDENHPHNGRISAVSLHRDAWTAVQVEADAAKWKSACAAAPVQTLLLPRTGNGPELVGALGDGAILPIQQTVTPAGKQILLPKQRPQGIAASPDGRYLVASGRSAELLVIDAKKQEIVERVPLPSGATREPPQAADHILVKDPKGQLSFHGLVFSPNGDRVYLSNVSGDIKVFGVEKGGLPKPSFSIPLTHAGPLTRDQEIPAGLAVSADGSRLYAALNLSDRLVEIDATNGAILRAIDVGVAPYDVALTGGKAYVSCWGGRRPDSADVVGPAGRGRKVRVETNHYATAEGSVSVIDLATGKVIREILTGLHASGLALSPDGRWLCVANANSDSVTVIDTRKDEIRETIPLHWQPRGYFGASPNALCFAKGGRQLLVCNGTQNAVAVLEFDPGATKLAGLIPVGWYPGAIAAVPGSDVVAVANVKGLGSGVASYLEGKASFNSHDHTGSLSLFPLPGREGLKAHTQTVLKNCRADILQAASLPPRAGQPPRPVPERAGEPSPIQHVVYIIKENRTYDQVLGDIPRARGDASLCVFGRDITPNQHKLCDEFVLLDNLYCCGVLSADGHQWSTSGFVTDYLEKQFAGFPRSYPDFCGEDEHDALAYSPKGFIWDSVIAKGLKVRNFGESSAYNKARWADPARKNGLSWNDHIANWERGGTDIVYSTTAGLPSLAAHSCTNTVGWETSIPDVIRAERFLEELAQWEKSGDMPNLSILVLPMDHTVGTSPGKPTPAAMVADNDLAMGRIVAALSTSRFWKACAVFAVEDDPQNGWDHVSAYRTTAYVASPYARRGGAVVSEFYSQNSILRTIELILGLPTLNQLTAIATPMNACFQDTPDLRPFEVAPNRVPLTQLNPKSADIKDRTLRRDAVASARMPWERVDACPEDVFNRILWRATRGADVPYPGWATIPEELLGDEDDEDEG